MGDIIEEQKAMFHLPNLSPPMSPLAQGRVANRLTDGRNLGKTISLPPTDKKFPYGGNSTRRMRGRKKRRDKSTKELIKVKCINSF